jgi:selenocysteine lyase/cysteine desulfurase
VTPNVTGSPETPGGWRCVHAEKTTVEEGELIVPSKASILSKIRWVMFEKKAIKKEKAEAELLKQKQANETENGTQEQDDVKTLSSEAISAFARSQFPYFSDAQLRCPPQVFFENAGGSQVAQPVIDAVTSSLMYRHRSIVGTKTKTAARETFRRIIGAMDSSVFVGPNATSLLAALADKYVKFGLLSATDEVVISTENHLANYEPWMKAAKESGAKVKLWTPFGHDTDVVNDVVSSDKLEDLINANTRIVAIPHASNILGQIRDIKSLTKMIKSQSQGHAHVVVDGVAAVPHCFAAVDDLQVDWYVVSCHKLFGPHLGGLCGRRSGAVEQLSAAAGSSSGSDDCVLKMLESGTVNYEACAGVIGLGVYLSSLASFSVEDGNVPGGSSTRELGTSQQYSQSGEDCAEASACVSTGGSILDMTKRIVSLDEVREAYRRIRISEAPLVEALLRGLRRSNKVRVIEADKESLDCIRRLPTVGFTHADIAARQIHASCEESGIACRCSSFLCTEYLARDFGFDYSEGILRVSLAHYNTLQEIDSLLHTLESIPGWY